MKKLLVLIASPKKRKSQTERYIAELLKNINESRFEIDKVYLYELNYSNYLYQQISNADVVVLGTPLYVDSLPAKVVELFEALDVFIKENYIEKKPQVYLVINCGFMEYVQNNTAIEIVRCFCQSVGYRFMQTVSIGSGAIILESRQRNKVERAMYLMAKAIEGREFTADAIEINVKMPKFLFMSKANKLWIDVAKKRGLTKKDLKAKYLLDLTP